VSVTGGYAPYCCATVYVIDDDTPSFSIPSVEVLEGNSGTKTVRVNLVMTPTAFAGVEIPWQTLDGTANGSDYTRAAGYAFIAPGNTSTTIEIQIAGDTHIEPDETFRIVATSPLTNGPVSGTVTILNDDIDISPSSQTVARGSTAPFQIDGLASQTDQIISLRSLDPSIARVPETVIKPASSRSITIDATAVGTGSTQILATLPPALGGLTLTGSLTVFEGTAVVFDTRSLTVPLDKTASVRVSLDPPQSNPVVLSVSSNSQLVDVPAVITIPAGGAATLAVKGVKIGGTAVNVTLPSTNGGATFALIVDVADPAAILTVSKIAPTTGPDAGRTAVTINGTQLRPDCAVTFGDVPASVTSGEATFLAVATPAHSAGTVDVTITCGSASASLPNAFTFVSTAPLIAQVSPSFGSTAGGTLIRVTGENFTSGCWPFLDSLAARGALVKGNEIFASTPAHGAATVDVAVRCENGRDAAQAKAFNYVAIAEPSPVIMSLTPLAAAAGQTVVISGAWLNGNDRVDFGGVAATVVAFAPDALSVRVPLLPLGRASVTVTDGSGGSSTTGPIFTVLESRTPQITSVGPSSVVAGGEVTIEGSGFQSAYTFVIGEVKAAVITSTYTQAVVRVPDLPAGIAAVNIVNSSGNLAAIGTTIMITRTGLAITSVSQSCATTEGGANIVIHGQGFASGARVTFDGRVAANAVIADAQTINVTLPPLAVGMPTISVANPNGSPATLTNAMRIYSPFDPDRPCSR
jgi:hypothetical protein